MKFKKHNSDGFSHDMLLVFFVVLFAITSVAYLVFTHAASAVITNPTHIMDEQWNFFGPTQNYNLTSMTANIEPLTNGPTIGTTPDGYFYADEFYFNDNGTGYMGLQDEGNDGNGNTLAKSAMVQIYGATAAGASQGATAGCGNPSSEGYGCYLHEAINWQPGQTYTFKIYLLYQVTATNGTVTNVWSTNFTNTSTGVTTSLGTISTPAAFQYLGNAVITFHERFSGPTDSCSDQMPSAVSFSQVTADSGSLVAQASNPISNSFTSSCSGYVNNTVQNNVVTSSYALSNATVYAPQNQAPAKTITPPATTNPVITRSPKQPVTITLPVHSSVAPSSRL